MEKLIYRLFGLSALLVALLLFGGLGQANAEVSVGISLNFGSAPQEVVMVPGGVYYVPNQEADIFFYGGYWWTIHENNWYRAHEYNGSWTRINNRYLPLSVYSVYRTPNYRQHFEKSGGRHLPYAQLKNWDNHDRNGNNSQGAPNGNRNQGGHKGK